MRITPLDIRKQDFKRGMRGFDPEEVQAFLQMVAEHYQELVDENDDLEKKIVELNAKLGHYKQVEEAMQEALKTTRESSRQTLEAARMKAKSVVDEAVATATRIQKKAQDEQYELRRDVQRLASKRHEVVARLRGLLSSHLEMLSSFEADVGEEDDLTELEVTAAAAEHETEGSVEETEAVKEMEEIEDAGDDMLQFGQDDDTLLEELADQLEDELVTSEPEPEVAPEGPEPVPVQKTVETRRDSPEMDKIRKILDDLV